MQFSLKVCQLLLCAMLFTFAAHAQDKIYKRNGDVIEATVRSVGPRSVIYTLYGDQDVTDKSILKLNVTRIVYANGDVDMMDDDRFGRMPRRRSTHIKDTTSPRMNSGKNILSLVTGYSTSPIDQSINDVGVGLCYERLLDKWGHLSFNIPVMIFFSSAGDYYHDYFGNSYGVSGSNVSNGNGAYTTVYLMPGIKFYPIADTKLVRYSLGLSLLYMLGSEPLAVYENAPTYSNFNPSAGAHNYAVYGFMITNSLNVTTANHVCLSFDIGIGTHFFDNRFINSSDGGGPNPIIQLGLKLGYRY